MREAIFAYIDQDGEGLQPKVKEALLQLMNPSDDTAAPRYLPL
jgi:hypothetical protein